MGTDIEYPSGETVHDMEENIIYKYCSDPTVEGGFIVVGVYVINISSLQPLSKLSKLSKPPKYLSFITY